METTKPILPWDSETQVHPKLVWRAKLDNRYLIEVERTSDYEAQLRIFDHGEADTEIASWPVSLSYGAKFGPDVSDVAEWQDKCANFVDTR